MVTIITVIVQGLIIFGMGAICIILLTMLERAYSTIATMKKENYASGPIIVSKDGKSDVSLNAEVYSEEETSLPTEEEFELARDIQNLQQDYVKNMGSR